MAKSLPSLIGNAVEINSQYMRLAQSDIKDIEDLAPGEGCAQPHVFGTDRCLQGGGQPGDKDKCALPAHEGCCLLEREVEVVRLSCAAGS